MKTSRSFLTSKTTWTAIAAIITALAGAVHGSITWPEAITAIFAALGAAFHRDAIGKLAEAVSAPQGPQ